MKCSKTLHKFLSLPKKPKLELETQIKNAADISNTNFLYISSVFVGSLLFWGTELLFTSPSSQLNPQINIKRKELDL